MQAPNRALSREGARTTADFVAERGFRLGRFDVLECLGIGGMAKVYRARDRGSETQVALKVPRCFVEVDEAKRTFHREFHLARRVAHRNVVRVRRRGSIHGVPYLAMQCIEGSSLADVIAREGAIPEAEALYFALGLCEGVAAIHHAGILHCDLKPDNIMISEQGSPVITDFGIARAIDEVETWSSGVCGSPAYMAPEQVMGDVLTASVDVFAIGVVMFEMLTGRRPWTGDAPREVALRRLFEGPPDPRAWTSTTSDEVAELVLRCLTRLPSERPESAAELYRQILESGRM